jgi:magnesium chelatase family protein
MDTHGAAAIELAYRAIPGFTAGILIGSMNPCPCGYHGAGAPWGRQPCSCTPTLVSKYQKRISGPLVDRIDIHWEVQQVPVDKLQGVSGGESCVTICVCVKAVQQSQRKHFTKLARPTDQ